jgi:hypothetical protein
MRTSFEFKITADDITQAKEIAIKKVGAFLNLPEDSVLDNVNLELKVSYPEAKTLAEITQNEDGTTFVVTVYGSVKQSITKPFGF